MDLSVFVQVIYGRDNRFEMIVRRAEDTSARLSVQQILETTLSFVDGFNSCVLCFPIQYVACLRFVRVAPTTWSEIEQENPLNLSISISGGKETNKDSPSNGE